MVAFGFRSGVVLVGLVLWAGALRSEPAPARPTGSGPVAGSRSVSTERREVVAAIRRPLVLAPAMCQATLVMEANMGVRHRFEPLSLAPDVHCGIAPRLMLGITHSARSLSLVDSGDGVCLSGATAGCPRPYDGTALDALTPLREGAVALAARARLVAASYSPVKPSLRLGALVRLRHGRAALLLDPHVALGMANRDRGNRDQLSFPILGQLQPDAHVMVVLRTGVRGELATFRDSFAIPIGAGVEVSPAPEWDIGLEAAFPRLLGPLNTLKLRDLAFYVTYRASAPGW